MTAVRAPGVAALVLMAIAAASRGSARELRVSGFEARLAEELAQDASSHSRQGDRVAAAWTLIRATRWDPRRVADRQRAISWLAPFEGAAALRHTVIALSLDDRFGSDSPALLKRLTADAVAQGRWELAARLARRRSAVVASQPSASPRRRAELELEVGRCAWLANRADDASEAFARFQALRGEAPLAAEAETPPVGWESIAQAHVEAGRPQRAERAVSLWEQAEGETAASLAARARVAMLRGKPLNALALAKRTLARGSENPAYPLLVEALQACNQRHLAVGHLENALEGRTNQPYARMLLIAELARAGRMDESIRQSDSLFASLAERVGEIDRLRGPLPGDDPTGDRRMLLAEAAEQRLRTLATAARTEELFGCAAIIAARFGTLDRFRSVLRDVLSLPSTRPSAQRWVERFARGVKVRPAPPGHCRAAAAVAVLVDRPDEARVILRQRLAPALGGDGPRAAAIDESVGWVEWLASNGQPAAAVDFADSVLRIGVADEATTVSEPEAAAIAALHEAKAEALLHAGLLPGGKPSATAQARRALRAAMRLRPDDPNLTVAASRAACRAGDFVAAAALAKRVIDAAAASSGESGRRARLVRARALAAAGGAGQEIDELYEQVLDRWPDDTEALCGLATRLAASNPAGGRALRMVRRAARLSPRAPAVWVTLGRVLLDAAQTEEAIECFDRALELHQVAGTLDTTTREQIGRWRERAGEQSQLPSNGLRGARPTGSSESAAAGGEPVEPGRR